MGFLFMAHEGRGGTGRGKFIGDADQKEQASVCQEGHKRQSPRHARSKEDDEMRANILRNERKFSPPPSPFSLQNQLY